VTLHSLSVTSSRATGVPDRGPLLAELERVGYGPIPEHAIHYSVRVDVHASSSLRMAWSGPALPPPSLQAASRTWPTARFDLGTVPVGGVDDEPHARWTFVNGTDVNRLVDGADLGDKQ
jgi:hypothetical protein